MSLGLTSQHIDLHLFTLNTKKHFKAESEIPIDFKNKTHYTSFSIDTSPTILGAALTVLTNKSYFISRFYNKVFEKKIIQFLKQEHVDIVQIEGLFMCSYIPIIRKHSSAKIVLRSHNLEHLIWERHIQQTTSPLKKWYIKIENRKLRKYEINAFSEVDAVIPITPKDAFLIKQLCKTPIHIALTGTNIDDYEVKKSLDFDAFSLFHFGSMDWLPNQEAVDWFLINCWEKIKKAIPNSKFVIAGRNIPDKYKQLKDTSILIEENVPTSAEIYNKYNIMIVPVLSGSGLRIKIVEGMCYAKAIVSTTIGAEGIECELNKDIVISDSSKDFSNSIINLLKEKDKREQMERNARNFAIKRLNYEPIAKNLVAFYQQLIATDE
jgi:glycosyltransferase involved in cell wall biosynthesis